MKKFPYPDKPLRTENEVKKHIEALCVNAMSWLQIDGYRLFVFLPKQPNWHDASDQDASLSVRVGYPYKRIYVSIQKASLEQMIGENKDTGLWHNVEQGAIHEMVHVLLWNLVEVARSRFATARFLEETEESTVDHIANVIHDVVVSSRKRKK